VVELPLRVERVETQPPVLVTVEREVTSHLPPVQAEQPLAVLPVFKAQSS